MIDKNMKKSLVRFEPISDRLLVRSITMLSAHAPTEEKYEMETKEFYDLSKTCDQVPKYDMLIILGDFNAKIGKEQHIAHVAGKYTIHNETSANGNLLTQFAQMYNLIIMSTCFDHKIVQKGTWKTPVQEVTTQISQIDHVPLSSRHASSIMDIRTYRGPNCDPDHILVKAREKDYQTHINRKE
jgi:hypothetical protein